MLHVGFELNHAESACTFVRVIDHRANKMYHIRMTPSNLKGKLSISSDFGNLRSPKSLLPTNEEAQRQGMKFQFQFYLLELHAVGPLTSGH